MSTTTGNRFARLAVPTLAAGLAGLALPLAAVGPSVADDGDGDGAAPFGYSAQTSAQPVYVEIYEPTIPIPATPQAEMSFAYTKVVADSSTARGRASFVWPGDAVGEGAKTIEESVLTPFHLPAEITDPIYEAGYPVQVNSGYPSGPEVDEEKSFPGAVERTGATEKMTYAQTGYSVTCDTSGDDGDDDGDGGGGGIPGVPGLPDLPLPLPTAVDGVLPSDSSSREATTSRSSVRTAADEGSDEETDCQTAPLAALASFGGMESATYTQRTDDEIIGVSRSAVGDVTIAGGVVVLSGVTAKVTSSSDGTKPVGKGRANYGTITIGGEEFAIGPDGIEGGGQSQPIPGLPDDPDKALQQLGITITVPKPVYEVNGKAVKSLVEGLVVQVDTKTLSGAIRQLPLQDVIAQLPDDFAELKKALQAAANLSPRIVMHLGRAASKVETADPIDIPDTVPDNDPGDDDSTSGGSSGGTSSSGGLGGTSSGGTTPPASSPSGSTPEASGDLPPAELASGLPPLFSIPGLLLFGGLAGACVLGSYVRRLGAAALGAGGACSHGLDSGLPDLRKA